MPEGGAFARRRSYTRITSFANSTNSGRARERNRLDSAFDPRPVGSASEPFDQRKIARSVTIDLLEACDARQRIYCCL
jgi:hypothetical protein